MISGRFVNLLKIITLGLKDHQVLLRARTFRLVLLPTSKI